MSDPSRRARWHAYYSEKRIVHQWQQVALLEDLAVSRVLEIGPYLGLAGTVHLLFGADLTAFLSGLI